jgi:glycosyltransferase involved in cell wall biosynthesis
MGGVTALYEFGNGLSRRGHEVHIAHGAFWGRPGVRSLEELSWFEFEPGVEHHFGEVPIALPPADIIFGTDAPIELGLPVLVIQGFEMFPKELERATFRARGLKVCIASWLVRAAAQYGVDPTQVVHVPMGIDHSLFRTVAEPGGRAPLVGMLYNSHPAKGWDPGWAALERVHAAVPGMRALIFGTEVPASPLPGWATFLRDPTPQELVEEVYNRCQVFVQPSYYEGFGFTAVEAMACGCALVSTDNGGSEDYAIPGETALVAAPGEIDDLARQVQALLGDDALRTRLATAGLGFVRRFDWDRAAALLEGHLERYLADPAAFQKPPLPMPDDPATAAAGPTTDAGP